MKKFILGILVLGLVLGFGQLWASNNQEEKSEFKLLSPKELVKELRDPDSKRLGAWKYLAALEVATTPVDGWLYLTGEKIMPKLLSDPDVAKYLSIKEESNEPSLYEKILCQNFEYDKFEQDFHQALSVFKKIVIIIQENLDPSREEHQKALKDSTELIKKLENPDLLTTQGLLQHQVEFLQFVCAFQFIQEWLIKSEDSISLDNKEALEPLFVETFVAGKAVQEYLNKTIDKNSEEFQKTFAQYLKTFQEKLDKLIKFIETLPEK